MDEHIAAGSPVALMSDYPPPGAGAYVLRAPGQHPVRKIRILTELLMKYWNDREALAALPGHRRV